MRTRPIAGSSRRQRDVTPTDEFGRATRSDSYRTLRTWSVDMDERTAHMAIQSATPYLVLNGRTRQAVALYERALGAKVRRLQTFGDIMGSCPDAQRHRVMHCELQVGDGLLMLSDGIDDAAPQSGSVSVAIGLDDRDQTRRSFDALAASGAVIEKLGDAPWGALFGAVRDELGVHWMLNCATR
jgi:PhnB protein